MSASAPILRCGDWAALVAALAESRELAPLRDLPLPAVSAVMAAPAALARWLAVAAPELAARHELSILVIGAESTDAPDKGRWYQLVSAMLGVPIEVRATLVGAQLNTSFSSRAAAQAPPIPALCVREELADFLDTRSAVRFDVAALFQPGFQKHRAWLAGNGLPRLLAAGTLVIGSSNAVDEFEMERWVLASYGYRVSEEPVPSPFFLDLSDAFSSIRWGSTLWRIESPPLPSFCVDERKLAALDTLTRMVGHSMTVAGEAAPAPGAATELIAADGTRRDVIHVFDQRFVDPHDGTVLRLNRSGALEAIGMLSPDEVAEHPGSAARAIERAIWAAAIKERHLLASYPRKQQAGEAAEMTRGMFDAMRTRAARLFR